MKKLENYCENELMTAIRKCDEGFFVCILPISMIGNHFGCEFEELSQDELDIIQLQFQESDWIDFGFNNILDEITSYDLIKTRE
jgi:hypothetical protein